LDIKHCGYTLSAIIRQLAPSLDERERGVIALWVYEYHCCDTSCRRRLFYKQEQFQTGCTEVMRVKPQHKAALVRRLRLAKQSNAVQGTVREKNSGKYMFKSSIRVD